VILRDGVQFQRPSRSPVPERWPQIVNLQQIRAEKSFPRGKKKSAVEGDLGFLYATFIRNLTRMGVSKIQKQSGPQPVHVSLRRDRCKPAGLRTQAATKHARNHLEAEQHTI